MKVILPVAGVGTRLRPLTLHRPKCLLPIAGSTILGHILDALEDLPISETIFVTGYLGDQVEEYIQTHYAHTHPVFVKQENPQGLGEAIHLCSPHLSDEEPTLIILGDTLFQADLSVLSKASSNILLTRYVEDPRRFGVAVCNEQGRIEKLVEKPETPISHEALVGIYYIQNSSAFKQSLQYLMDHNIRTRGEYQLTDALQHMIENQAVFHTGAIDGWLDCGKPETMLETNQTLLQTKNFPLAQFQGCTIIPPCFIDKNVKLTNSTIGPHVSIAENSILENVTIENSVVAPDCQIRNSKLRDSLIGDSCSVDSTEGSMYLGNHCAINPD